MNARAGLQCDSARTGQISIWFADRRPHRVDRFDVLDVGQTIDHQCHTPAIRWCIPTQPRIDFLHRLTNQYIAGVHTQTLFGGIGILFQ